VVTSLPTPIAFRLPEDWRPVPPDEVNAPGAAFVAMLPDPHPDAAPDADGNVDADADGADADADASRGFTANVTIDGEYRPDAEALTTMAEHSVQILRDALAGPEAVAVLNRSEVGSAQAPALTQTLKITTSVDGVDLQLMQSQVYLSMVDSRDPARRAVIRLVLTATAEQHRAALPDFQWLVSTVRPDDARS
jgi:hypothetical protein